MLEHKKFAIIGGDKRSIYLSNLLAKDGHTVSNYAFDSYDIEVIPECENIYQAIDGVDYIIGPTPCSHNGFDMNFIYSHKVLSCDDLFRLIKPNQIFFAGHIKDQVYKTAEKYQVRCEDILKMEELAVLNAIPTAEGAIKIAVENTDFTLHDANVMVIGYGRVGKILCKMLTGFGSHIYPVTKERSDYALAKSLGFSAVMYDDMNEKLSKMNIIINTVPKILLDRKNIKYIDKSCLIIDLASAPNGIDFNFAKSAGLSVIFTGSLPGIIAPKSAAYYNLNTIYARIKQTDSAADLKK
ncbi:MAG: dipicolinate synthase subunit DpsA [Clostridiales bacterium]|nr:dipicolinate synthase subunit DpsA [Clostridiales bacterium]